MVRLKNLKKNNNLAECDFLPEDSQIPGHMIVDLESGDIIEYTLPEKYEWCTKHVYHAARNLKKLIKNNEFPNNYLVMWV